LRIFVVVISTAGKIPNAILLWSEVAQLLFIPLIVDSQITKVLYNMAYDRSFET